MRALLRRAYGGPEVLRVEEIPVPVPGDGEVLIRVRAASINAMDVHFLAGRPGVARLFTGLAAPKDPRTGSDVAGEVQAVGAGVTRFAPGDAVFGACRGALADYACAAEGKIARKPDAIGFAEAAALPVAGSTALQGLRDAGGLRPGEAVLVLGAGGGVGGFAVQIAKALGARVTAASSGANLARMPALGADRTLDHVTDDLASPDGAYDLIFDLGGGRSFAGLRRLLSPEGRIVTAGVAGIGRPGLGALARWGGRILAGKAASRLGPQKLVFAMARLRPADLETLAAMAAAGTLKPPVTQIFSLEEAPDAFGRLVDKRAAGKLVVEL